MLRLTIRSSLDGRYLARIVDRGGFPFVLDFGDAAVIEDASQRLMHGFTMWRHGRLISAPPGDPALMPLLAEYYAGEGLLVFLEEPTWAYRNRPVDLPPDDEPTEESAEEPYEDDPTEVL